eukprot:NODE_30335_length_421_cov_2.343537.p3 GENE.NODE_30335_length_421_cov_2.343537~~NODE_30335_length_421_cov_2.343537.p3  ORF type:complete len:63 (-),score=17.52 NODE_30335_length_421_cov_2.343537:30-218(-)
MPPPPPPPPAAPRVLNVLQPAVAPKASGPSTPPKSDRGVGLNPFVDVPPVPQLHALRALRPS